MTEVHDGIVESYLKSKAAKYRDIPQKRCDMPVFEFDFSDFRETKAGRLPLIWVTVPLYETTGGDEPLRRDRIDCWPQFYEDDAAPQDDETPLQYGSWYYNEAMRYQAPDEHEMRVEAFQAAEVLYLWAAAAGNVQAVVNLGYIYSYDRCENGYWARTLRIIEGDDDAYGWECPRDAWAYACWQHGAERGHAESCYKLGDFQKYGRGCAKDEAAALASYRRGYELSKGDGDGYWGPPALRLATCYEEGIGCDPDFEQARHWYGIARAGLSIIVNSGNWYYRRSLNQAEDGAKRMDQELS